VKLSGKGTLSGRSSGKSKDTEGANCIRAVNLSGYRQRAHTFYGVRLCYYVYSTQPNEQQKESAMTFPAELKYTKNDEWIRVQDGVGTVGITDYAQDQLSDIVFLEISASEGDELSRGDELGEIESVKAAAEIYLPVDGKVTQVNGDIIDEPEVINSDPYGDGWLVQLEIKDPAQLEDLMDAAAYEEYCQDREH
jgi:glycine cleavage system H protein